MKQKLGLITALLLIAALAVPLLSSAPVLATQTTTIFSDNFGASEADTVPGWTDSDGSGSDAAIRLYSGNGYLRLRSGAMVTKSSIDTTGLTNIHLEYTWGQETDSDGTDDGDLVVRWKLSSSGTWTTLNTHDLSNGSTTAPNANSVEVALGSSAADTSIDIRFWGDTDEDDDRARVDNIVVSGDPLCTPGALEVCDGIDNDCDQLVDADDPDFIPLKVQVAMVLDGSGSIDSTEWNIMVTGLAQALANSTCVPHDGTLQLTVIQFSTNAAVEIGPVVITAANAANVANGIMNIVQMEGSTCISCGLCLAADTLAASPCFDTSIKQAINLVTDGDPNRCSCSGGTCGYSGSSCNLASAQASAVCARDYLLTTLNMTEGQDELDAEGIGITDANRDWIKNNIIFPATGYSSPPGDWPPPSPGWVRVFATFEEFVPSLCEKFHAIIEEQCILNVISDGCCPITVGSLGTVGAGATGNFTVLCGTNVTLTADDCNPCCIFDYWSGNASGTNPTIQVTMDGNKTITDTCHWLTYNLTVESDGCCPITVEWDTSPEVEAGGTETFTNIPCGTNVTLTAQESDCCAFDYWTGDVPGGTNSTNPITITMSGNKAVTGTCHWICGGIGDTVFYDNNDNGIQDPGEDGIQGVTVQLYRDDGNGEFNIEATDELIDTQETDADGEYEFGDLPPFCDQGYWVLVDESTLPPGVNLTSGSNPTGPICLTEGEAYEGADFGYLGATLPVGGTAYPINKLAILAPWMALAAVIAGATILMRRRRAQS